MDINMPVIMDLIKQRSLFFKKELGDFYEGLISKLKENLSNASRQTTEWLDRATNGTIEMKVDSESGAKTFLLTINEQTLPFITTKEIEDIKIDITKYRDMYTEITEKIDKVTRDTETSIVTAYLTDDKGAILSHIEAFTYDNIIGII